MGLRAIALLKQAIEFGGRRLQTSVTGAVDVCREGCVEGWAWDKKTPDLALLVSILRDGIPIGTIVAEDYREDLAAAGIGNGKHAFRFSLPGGGPPDCVRVTAGEAGVELPRGKPVAAPEYQRFFLPLLSDGIWCVDDVSLSSSTLRFSGWAFHPPAITSDL